MNIINPRTKQWEQTEHIVIPVLAKPIVYDENYRFRYEMSELNLKVAPWESLLEIANAK